MAALIFVLIIMALIYLPVLFLVGMSFESGWQYYRELFTNAHYMEAVGNTLLIAVLAALAATLIATMAATGIIYMRKKSRAVTMAMNQLPVINADIVTSFALVLLFVGLGLSNLGLLKLILAHIVIALPFCLLTILPKIRQLDNNLIDAALDLGASPFKAFTSVMVPQLIPAMIQAFLLGFTLSLDDFVVTQYNNSGVPTISTVVYGAISRRDIPNAFRALTTIIFVIILIVLVILNLNAGRQRRGLKLGKKTVAIVTAAVLLLSVGGFVPIIANNLTPRSSVLKIYNWEDYISIGPDSPDLVAEFETYYRELTGNQNFRVEYHTFTDNEELYSKIKTQHADYDLVFPSEYMVEKMRSEKLLRTIDTTRIENYDGLDETILSRTSAYTTVDDDPDAVWAIPYMVGTVGILYDIDVIDDMAKKTGISSDDFETLLQEYGFGVLFGEGGTTAFKSHITMKKSARDSIAAAMIYAEQDAVRATLTDDPEEFDPTVLGDVLNMNGDFTIDTARKTLEKQIKDMDPYYENDTGKKSFADPNDTRFAYGLYWSCDAGLVMAENLDDNEEPLGNLKFYTPQGSNLWTDNFAMTKYGKNQDAAYAFIDFMLDPENAYSNIEYVGSEMAVVDAVDTFREEYGLDEDEDEFFYDNNYIYTVCPSEDAITYAAIMHNFDSKKESAVNELMVNIQNQAAQLSENSGGSGAWFFIALLIITVIGLVIWITYRLTHRRA